SATFTPASSTVKTSDTDTITLKDLKNGQRAITDNIAKHLTLYDNGAAFNGIFKYNTDKTYTIDYSSTKTGKHNMTLHYTDDENETSAPPFAISVTISVDNKSPDPRY